MASYATTAELKARLNITGTEQDAVLEQVLEVASREFDGWCGRTFVSSTDTRAVSADAWDMIILPADLHSITAIAIDRDDDRIYETVWAVSDVDMQPWAGPYQQLRPRTGLTFPTHRYAIQITGDWGYSASVPAPVKEATLLQAGRLFKRKDAPFGVAGTADHGEMLTISPVDPDVKELLKPYVRPWNVV